MGKKFGKDLCPMTVDQVQQKVEIETDDVVSTPVIYQLLTKKSSVIAELTSYVERV